jgi:hypothetical protein
MPFTFIPLLQGEDERILELPSVEKTAFEYVMRFLRVHAATPLQDIPKVRRDYD